MNLVDIIKFSIFLIISVINIITDLKKKQVFSITLIIITCISLLFYVFYDLKIFINCIFGVIGAYIIFIIIFLISKGGIGLGDMFYMGFFASLYGYLFTLLGFLAGFWSATIVIVIPLLLKKINKKTKIPMIPFLFFGCTGNIITGYILKFLLY